MIKNYFKITLRNLTKNKVYSFINIIGLAVGMAVTLMIGLWIYDELSFDKYHHNYKRLARVMVNQNFNGVISTQWSQPFPLGNELRTKYAGDFEHVTMASWNYGHFLTYGDNTFSKEGMFAEPEFIEMASLKMTKGTKNALNDLNSIIINESVGKTIFGNADPIGKVLKIDNSTSVSVTGVYEDIPYNSSFSTVNFLVPWKLFATFDWVKGSMDNWGNFSYQTLVQLKPTADLERVSTKIKDVILRNNDRGNESKPSLILHPMNKWHLYADFENGVNTGGDIQFVWLFGIIGSFVLLLACINFMNLSTARSEKRAKEVGLRKTIGSLRGQLIVQFLSESFLFVLFAFGLSIVFVQLALGWFNELADKKMTIPFDNSYFWVASIVFIFLTSLLAGSYPALYLSSFKPIQVLKGTFRVGRLASVPRKVLVVTQFTVSLTLIIGTIIVYRQVLHAKDRPIGYERNNLITTYGYPFNDLTNDPKRYDFLRNELLQTGGVVNMAKCSSPTTGIYSNQSDFDWEGRDPNATPNFGVIWCSHDYGKTVGLKFMEGRDFSRKYATDSAAIILNEAAVQFMGIKNPVGKMVQYNRTLNLKVIGVVQNMLMESPYSSIRPTVFMMDYNNAQILTLKINPSLSAKEALSKIEPVFKKFNPSSLFEVQFADEEFGKKFTKEERIGKLASFFAALAIFISCLGLFGMASFVAERRIKEIGIRKVLGASVSQVWLLLSKDFVVLILISCFIASPVAYYFLYSWLQQYEYRVGIGPSVFVMAAVMAITITIVTISFQAIKAAIANPVKSLRTE